MTTIQEFHSDSVQIKHKHNASTLAQNVKDYVWQGNELDKTILDQARASCGWKKIKVSS
jgi:hypothetical protein